MRRLGFALLILLAARTVHGQTSYDTTATAQTGEKVLGSYFSTDIDSVSLTNGQLHLSIPVFSIPGRELPLRFSLDYNSRFFEKRLVLTEEQDWIPLYEWYGWRANSGLGGSLTATLTYVGLWDPCCMHEKYRLDVYWIQSNGTKHRFTKEVVHYCCPTPPQSPYLLMNNQGLQSTLESSPVLTRIFPTLTLTVAAIVPERSSGPDAGESPAPVALH